MEQKQKSTFILDQRLYSVLGNLHIKGRADDEWRPSRTFTEEVSQKLACYVKEATEGAYNVQLIPFELLKSELDRLLEEVTVHYPDSTVVTTDRSLAFGRGLPCLEINRLITPNQKPRSEWWRFDNGQTNDEGDLYGDIIGLGPRPGYHNLDKQIEAIKVRASGTPVILLEDGAFSGRTLCLVIDQLSKAGIKVVAIVVGYLFPDANRHIREIFNGEIHSWQKPEDLNSHSEWMPDHDFIPFLPGTGRVLGYAASGINRPIYNLNGFHICRPYIYPFGDPTGWASIPFKTAAGFSTQCILLTARIFDEIERLAGQQVTIGDLRTSHCPRVGLPISVHKDDLPPLNVPVNTWLRTGGVQSSAAIEDSARSHNTALACA